MGRADERGRHERLTLGGDPARVGGVPLGEGGARRLQPLAKRRAATQRVRGGGSVGGARTGTWRGRTRSCERSSCDVFCRPCCTHRVAASRGKRGSRSVGSGDGTLSPPWRLRKPDEGTHGRIMPTNKLRKMVGTTASHDIVSARLVRR